MFSCGCSGCTQLSRSLVYFPPARPLFPCPVAEAAGAKNFYEDVQGQYLRAILGKSGAVRPKALAIFFHGNAEGACDRAALLPAFADLGLKLALAEYPGYGGDRPGPSEARILRNAVALVQRLRRDDPNLPLLLLGESLGTGVATYAASQCGADALALISPYTSLVQVGKTYFPWLPVGWLLTERFEAAQWAPKVRARVLIALAEQDRVVPAQISKRQAANFSSPPLLVTFPDAGHNEILGLGLKRFLQELQVLLASLEKRKEG